MGAPGGDGLWAVGYGRWLRRRSATFQVIRQLPNSCQIVSVCVRFFLGWTTAHIPAGLAAISTPCFANLNDFITFFPIFLSNSAGFFFLLWLCPACSSRHFAPSARLCPAPAMSCCSSAPSSTPLLLSFEIPARIQQNAAENQQNQLQLGTKKKASRIAAMQICRRPRTVGIFLFFSLQYFLFFLPFKYPADCSGWVLSSHPNPLEIRLSCCLNAGCKLQWTVWAPAEI